MQGSGSGFMRVRDAPRFVQSEDSVHVGAIGLVLEPLAQLQGAPQPLGAVPRFRWGRIPVWYVTKFTTQKALKSIA